MQLSAHAQAGLERFQAVFAANAHLSREELLRRCRQPHARSQRKPKPRAPRRRGQRPAPVLSRQYMRAIATTVMRDERLTYSARVLAGWIVALSGQRGFVETTRARLGGALKLSPRTITRLLADLEHYGYIGIERTKTRTGADAGLRLFVKPKLLPFYVVEGQGWTNKTGHVRTSKKQDSQKGCDFSPGATSRPPNREKG